MNRMRHLPLSLAVAAFASQFAGATTVIGDLNNFDTLNDTGQTSYGFEIEIDDVHSTDISYTFDWNHYGAPKIREDNTDPAHPKVFVRYESTPDSNGNWGGNNNVTNVPSFTNVAVPTNTPPQGHTCTDPSVNEGCEHFGVGFLSTPSKVVYNWLVSGGPGTLVSFGTPVNVATPNWNYTPPANGAPAQVVAAIPAPVVPIPAGRQFGEPSWVKVVKTTTHNPNPVELRQLVSADEDNDGLADWQNTEPDEVETEWKLLQANTAGNAAKDELAGGADDMGADGAETVTRRYEFYKYAAAPDTLDGENGEAMCSEVDASTDPNDPQYLHGIGSQVEVTDPNGDPYFVDCAAQVVVGDYVGAQMAGFDAEAPLGLIDHLQDGELNTPYVARTVVIGGNTPYTIGITGGNLPNGLAVDASGVMAGTPTQSGDFDFTIEASDSSAATHSQAYTLHIAGAALPQHQLTVGTNGPGGVSGNGIDCTGNAGTCAVTLDEGTAIVLGATPGASAVFNGWSSAYCSGSGSCSFSLTQDSYVAADFTQQYLLSVAKSGAGSGAVTGSGINCGATCSIMLGQGAPVALVAAAATGSYFTGWSGDCSGTGTCNTTMTAARSVSAEFVPSTLKYTLSVTHAGSGSVASAPKGISCGSKCSYAFGVGTQVTLTATPKKKHSFLGWTGACSGTQTTCAVTIVGNQAVGALFN